MFCKGRGQSNNNPYKLTIYEVKRFATINNKGHGYWHQYENQKLFLNELEQKLNIKRPRDWKNIRRKVIIQNGGSALLNRFSGNLPSLLKSVYPNEEWEKIFIKRRKTNQFWDIIDNQKGFMDKLFHKFHFQKLNDLETLNSVDIINQGGRGLLRKYKMSVKKLLNTLYPELKNISANNYWHSIENQRKFMDDLYEKLNLQTPLDWKNIKRSQISYHGGYSLINKYNWNFPLLLKTIYPEVEWGFVKLRQPSKTRKYWQSIENQKSFLNEIYQILNLQSLDDWKLISRKTIRDLGGAGLLRIYNENLMLVLQTIYPDHNWVFPKRNNELFMTHILRQLQSVFKVNRKEDWYRISQQLLSHYDKYLFENNGVVGMKILYPNSLLNALKLEHPGQIWRKRDFSFRSKKSYQHWLKICAQNLYPQHLVYEEYHHPNLIFSDSKAPVEIDVFIPALNMGLEYQGEQHYEDLPSNFNSMEYYQSRDNEKFTACSNEIKLVLIPYWWDKTPTSLHPLIALF